MSLSLKKLNLVGLLLAAAVWTGCQDQNPVKNESTTNSHTAQTGSPSDDKPNLTAEGDTILRCGTPDVYNPDELPVSGDTPVGDDVLGSFFDPTCKQPSPADLGIAIKCSSEEEPVCGCDGKTYRNACWAAGVGGVNAKHAGACK